MTNPCGSILGFIEPLCLRNKFPKKNIAGPGIVPGPQKRHFSTWNHFGGGGSSSGASAENGGDLPNELVHSRQLGWIVPLKFEKYFPYFTKFHPSYKRISKMRWLTEHLDPPNKDRPIYTVLTVGEELTGLKGTGSRFKKILSGLWIEQRPTGNVSSCERDRGRITSVVIFLEEEKTTQVWKCKHKKVDEVGFRQFVQSSIFNLSQLGICNGSKCENLRS